MRVSPVHKTNTTVQIEKNILKLTSTVPPNMMIYWAEHHLEKCRAIDGKINQLNLYKNRSENQTAVIDLSRKLADRL